MHTQSTASFVWKWLVRVHIMLLIRHASTDIRCPHVLWLWTAVDKTYVHIPFLEQLKGAIDCGKRKPILKRGKQKSRYETNFAEAERKMRTRNLHKWPAHEEWMFETNTCVVVERIEEN